MRPPALRYESTRQRRMKRNKTNYPLDAGAGIERIWALPGGVSGAYGAVPALALHPDPPAGHEKIVEEIYISGLKKML